MRSALERAGLGAYAEELLASAREGVRYWLERETVRGAAAGGTRFGGGPDVPRGFVWPVHQGVEARFVAQIDLAELARLLPGNDLAAAGMRAGLLSFFWWQEDEVGMEANGFRVFWFRGEPLERRADPWSLKAERVGLLGRALGKLLGRPPSETGQGWHACRAKARSGWWLNNFEFERSEGAAGAGRGAVGGLMKRMSDKERDVLLADEDDDGGLFTAGWFTSGHHVLGCAQPVQNAVEVEAELGETEGGAAGGEKEWLEAEARAAKPENQWRCLLEVTSDGAPGFCIGDWGRLYFMIRVGDLAAGRLEGVRLVTQCH